MTWNQIKSIPFGYKRWMVTYANGDQFIGQLRIQHDYLYSRDKWLIAQCPIGAPNQDIDVLHIVEASNV